MGIYLFIILIIICSFFLRVDRNNKIKCIWMIAIFAILTTISAVRSYRVGVDSIQYDDAFNKILKLDFNQSDSLRYEVGFFYLTKASTLVSKNSQILFIITSCIIIPSVGMFIYKYSKNVAFSTLLYLLFNIFFFNMTGMRQSLALAVLLFAYDNLVKDNYIRFMCAVLLASSFHSSAILFLICPLVKKIKYNKYSYIITIFISIIFFIFFKSVFLSITEIIGKYGSYIDSKEFGISNYFGAFFQFLLTFVIYTFCHSGYIKQRNMIKTEKYNITKISLILLSLDVICQIMAMKMNIIGRMHQYFWIYSIILIPNIVYNQKKAKNRLMLYIVITFLSFIYWLIIAICRPEWDGAIPYIPFWRDYL